MQVIRLCYIKHKTVYSRLLYRGYKKETAYIDFRAYEFYRDFEAVIIVINVQTSTSKIAVY